MDSRHGHRHCLISLDAPVPVRVPVELFPDPQRPCRRGWTSVVTDQMSALAAAEAK